MSRLLASEPQRSKYRTLGLVGRGQFGQVYCALHRQTGRLVALKALDCVGSSTHDFLRELKFLVTLEHPNIVGCQAIEHVQGKRYLVMDYCEGGTLRQLMDNHARLLPDLSVKLVCDVLAGLEHANRQGVVHCDIKPENILLSIDAAGWTARISDFGISRLSPEVMPESANLTGSPAYMAPERFYGQYSHSTDLYAVGVLLYELLAGHRPFSGAPAELIVAHLNQPVTIPADISAPLQTVILTALQKLKARRYQSAAEMLRALKQAQQSKLQFAPQPPLSAIVPPKFPLQVLRQEALLDRADCVAVAENLPLPEFDRYLRRSSLMFFSHAQTLNARSYKLGFLDRRPGKALRTDTLREPIRELIVRSSDCFAATECSIYRLSETIPQLLTRFHQPSRTAIDPRGQWMAVATLNNQNTAKILSIWSLPQPKLLCRPTRCASTLEELIAIVAVHRRHVVLVSQENGATRCDLFNRRGQALGNLNLPVRINRVFPTWKSHFLIATEVNHERSLMLLHLKPYRLTRVAIPISPKFVAAYTWGIVICDNHQLVAIDYNGQPIGQAEIPSGISAIAAYGEKGLAIATWNAGESTLYTLDLELIRSASL